MYAQKSTRKIISQKYVNSANEKYLKTAPGRKTSGIKPLKYKGLYLRFSRWAC